MYAHVEKPNENKIETVANSAAQTKRRVSDGIGLINHRQAAASQQQMQNNMNKSYLEWHGRIFDNTSGEQASQLQRIVQRAFINDGNNAALYPHLHTNGQFIGYTCTAAHGDQVKLRTNRGDIQRGWFKTVGEALGGQLDPGRRAHHDAILNWIKDNEPDVWAARR